jgi:hypothetical protein
MIFGDMWTEVHISTGTPIRMKVGTLVNVVAYLNKSVLIVHSAWAVTVFQHQALHTADEGAAFKQQIVA